MVVVHFDKKCRTSNRPIAYYTLEPILRPSRPIHLNVHIEFDPGMVGKGVLVCYMTSLRKWSIVWLCVCVFFFYTVRNCASCHSPPTSLLDCWPIFWRFQDFVDEEENKPGSSEWQSEDFLRRFGPKRVVGKCIGNHMVHFGVFFTGVLATLNLDKNAWPLFFLKKGFFF